MFYSLIKSSPQDQVLMEQQEKIANQLALEKCTEYKIKKKILLDE